MLRSLKTRVRARLRLFGLEERGVAAVEFAIILPLMLLLYVGIIDVTRGVIASRKLNLLSRTVSDLVSQQPTTNAVTISKLSAILGSASAVMRPFPISTLKLTVSAVDIKRKSDNTCCNVLVRWSFTQAGSQSYLRTCADPQKLTPVLTQVADGTSPTLTNFPQSLVTANQSQQSKQSPGSTYATSYVIIADAYYTYSPIFLTAIQWFNNGSSWFAGGMQKTTFMVPRAPSSPITIADPSTASSPQMGCSSAL